LINTDKKGLTDPFAKIILLPDEKKETKRQTKVIKDSLNPVWEQIFDYIVTFAEANSKIVRLTFLDDKGIFEKQATTYLGEVIKTKI
jgi:Ca2+-dependent lipid-binding protein